MPNHVMNVVTFNGNNKKLQEILEAIKADEIGYGSIDFNKIEPMPTELNIESGSKTNEGLKYYKDFVYVYTAFAKRTKDELLNIPKEKEEIFLRVRKDIDRKAWELGRQAYRNELKYGAPTWYEWTNKHWGTKWNAYGYDGGCGLIEDNKISFETAWGSPKELIQKLSEKYPGVTIEVEWAVEFAGSGEGRYEYKNGKLESEYYPESEKEQSEFSDRVWAEGYSAGIGMEIKQ